MQNILGMQAHTLHAMLVTLAKSSNTLMHRLCPNNGGQNVPDIQAGVAMAGAGELAILEGLAAGLLSLPMLLLLFSLL